MKKKILIIALVIVIGAFLLYLSFRRPSEVRAGEYRGSLYENNGLPADDYYNYAKRHEDAGYASEEIIITALDNYEYSGGLYGEECALAHADGTDGLYIPESGSVLWSFTVPAAGLYHIVVTYYPTKGRSAAIARGLEINGALPFKEASCFVLSRIWVDEFDVAGVRVAGQADIKPGQVEKNRWNTEAVRDTDGYYGGKPYAFYLEDGPNTLTFIGVREPVIISDITLCHIPEEPEYKDMLHFYQESGYEEIAGILFDEGYLKIQGEAAYEKSSPILAPTANWSSYKVDPYERFIIRYNIIGGYSWRVGGDWITWRVDAPAAGLYRLTFKVLQNTSQGMDSTRILHVNGRVPFRECRTICFHYKSDWQNVTPGDEDGDYLFYLEKGWNDITLEATIGVYDNAIRVAEQLIAVLNRLYRKVIMITGVAPGKYQDYLLRERIDDLDEMIADAESGASYCVEEIIRVSKERGSLIVPFERTLLQLRKFKQSEQNIQRGLQELEDNIASLGTWVMGIAEQPLAVDCLYIHGSAAGLPTAGTNFFQKLWHELVMLFGSYSAGATLESSLNVEGPTITVWIFSGRDQSLYLRQLIDECFTRQKNINVKLKLVNATALMPATLSGRGPDVAMGVGQNIPVNWGIRNALVDLARFSDLPEVINRFNPSAVTAFTFREAVYALPDTEDFLVTFVRKDIAAEMNFTVPSTWDEVLHLVPSLQRSYLDYYIPCTRGALSGVMYAMIVQNEGALYKNDGAETALLERPSTEAFIHFSQFFTDYGFPLHANFPNRFRSGETPIGIYNYSLYNTLAVFAPEIRGQWEFAPLPGYKRDERVFNQTVSTVTGTVMLASSREKEAAWEYIKWWLSAETQTQYGRGMEAILGAAARYPTANIEAFRNLPWSLHDYYTLEEQRKTAVGVPTVPGDYIVGRHLDNAFRSALNNNLNPRDTLFEYAQKINAELARKRKEFDLD